MRPDGRTVEVVTSTALTRPARMSPWRARIDLAFGHALRLLALGPLADARPQIYRFLADRYWRLADWHAANGHERTARRLRARGDYYWGVGGGEDPPPAAVAAAMAIPRRASLFWAVWTLPG